MSSSGLPKTPKKVCKSVGANILNCCRLFKSFGDVPIGKTYLVREIVHCLPLRRISTEILCYAANPCHIYCAGHAKGG